MMRTLHSFLSAVAGWVVGVMAFALRGPYYSMYSIRQYLQGLLLLSFYVGIVVFPIWLFLLWPLSLFIPTRSVLWRPWLCISSGAIAATLLLAVPVLWLL